MDWQTIESAPKDGEEILVGEAGTGNVELVRFLNGEWLDRTSDPFVGATHWVRISPP